MDRRKYQTFEERLDWPLAPRPLTGDRPASDTLMRQVGARAPTTESDVLVPVGQAMWCGVFSAAVLIMAFVLAGRAWWLVVSAGGLGFFVMTGTVYAVLLVDSRKLLWATERATHMDLDGDGAVGRRELVIEITHKDEAGRVQRVERLKIKDITDEQFLEFARDVAILHMPTSVHYWTGKDAPFTRAQFDSLMAEMIRVGWVRDEGKQGRVLTAAGRVILAKMAGAQGTLPGETPLPKLKTA